MYGATVVPSTLQIAFPLHACRVPLADLEALVQEGQAIGIKMDSLTELAGMASAAQAWDQQAAFCLLRDQAQHAKHRKAAAPSLAVVTELLQQHDSLAEAVPHAADLLQKQQQALDWVSKADKALQQSDLQQHSSDVQVNCYSITHMVTCERPACFQLVSCAPLLLHDLKLH